MLIRLFLFVLLQFFLTQNTSACSFPNSGDEYNSKIEVTVLEGELKYKFAAPAMVNESGFTEVYLSYSREHEGFIMAEESIELQFEKVGDKIIGRFTLTPKDGLRPYLRVYWQPSSPGLCGTVAISSFLDSFNV